MTKMNLFDLERKMNARLTTVVNKARELDQEIASHDEYSFPTSEIETHAVIRYYLSLFASLLGEEHRDVKRMRDHFEKQLDVLDNNLILKKLEKNLD